MSLENSTLGSSGFRSFFRCWILIPLLIIGSDQLTKSLISHKFSLGEIDPIIPGFFNLTLAHNYGAAFGLFSGLPSGYRETALLVATLFAIGILIFIARSPHGKQPLTKLSVSLVLSGAIGNIIDRVYYGYVVDFLDIYINSYHWPAFNIADSAISVGVAILILFTKSEEPNSEIRN